MTTIQMKEKTMIRFSISLALVAVAITVPVAQAESYGPLDPPIAAAIQMHRLDYGPLDPPIAAAIQMHQRDYGPLDPAIAAAIQTRRSAESPRPLAVRVDGAVFDWGDFAVGAGATLALMLALAGMRKGVSTVRSRHSAGFSA
jgi:hypothetical protein